jgi:eukaryotic-like serine/threonine-protein kinase
VNGKKKIFTIVFLSTLLLSEAAGSIHIMNVGIADSVVNDWPMFQHDAAHSGSPDNVAPTSYDLLWSFNTLTAGNSVPPVLSSSPAVVGDMVYVGSDDGNLYALNTSTGSRLWNRNLGDFPVNSPAVVSGVVYASVWEGRDYALNASTGAIIWNASRMYSYSSPAVSNGLYYICSEGNLTALNTSNGNLVWNYPLNSNGDGSPVVVGNTVYVSDSGYAYAFDALTGTLKWSYFMREGNTFTSPAVVNGVVYSGSEGNFFLRS